MTTRILRCEFCAGQPITAFEHIDLLAAGANSIAQLELRLKRFDAVLLSSLPVFVPPVATVLNGNTEFFRVNCLLRRNNSVVHMLGGCSTSLPCRAPDKLPVGLVLWHASMQDAAVLDAAPQVENLLKRLL